MYTKFKTVYFSLPSQLCSSLLNLILSHFSISHINFMDFFVLFYRWWKTTISPTLNGSGRGRARKQRYLMIGILVLFGFVTLLAIFHYFGRSGDENDFHGDPMLDPMSNPNIRVGDH